MCTNANDTPLVEVDKRFLRHVGYLARDFLFTSLRVPNVQFQLLNMNRAVDVLLHEAFGDDDRVFEVVPVPRHERHHDVLPEGQLAMARSRPISNDVSGLHFLVHRYQRPLVDSRILVRSPELAQPIAVVLH